MQLHVCVYRRYLIEVHIVAMIDSIFIFALRFGRFPNDMFEQIAGFRVFVGFIILSLRLGLSFQTH